MFITSKTNDEYLSRDEVCKIVIEVFVYESRKQQICLLVGRFDIFNGC